MATSRKSPVPVPQLKNHTMKLTPKIRSLTMVAAASLALMVGMTARADYPSAVLADGPLTYHRFNETGVVSMQYPLVTNIGTLGAAVNGADYSTDLSGPAIGKGLAGAVSDPANTAFSFPCVTDTAGIVPYDPVLAPLGP